MISAAVGREAAWLPGCHLKLRLHRKLFETQKWLARSPSRRQDSICGVGPAALWFWRIHTLRPPLAPQRDRGNLDNCYLLWRSGAGPGWWSAFTQLTPSLPSICPTHHCWPAQLSATSLWELHAKLSHKSTSLAVFSSQYFYEVNITSNMHSSVLGLTRWS